MDIQKFDKTILSCFSDSVVVFDSTFKILSVNQAFTELCQLSSADLCLKNISSVVKFDESFDLNKLDEYMLNGQVCFSAEIKVENLEVVQVRVSFSKYNDVFIALIIPITEVSFLNKAHLDFISTVSHELRTPLTSIRGFIDTLISAGEKLDSSQKNRFLNIIRSQVDRLTRLVENLLMVSKLESGTSSNIFREINLKDFIENIVFTISQKSDGRKILINIAKNMPYLWTDADKLEQVILNLLDNAVKYSFSNSDISIEAGFTFYNDEDYAEIKVMDNGVGIPAEHLQNIFTRFSRIDNPLTRQVQGTGLGLYITKALVDDLGGIIEVKSQNNVTIFTVKIPLTTFEKHISDKFYGKAQ